MMRSYKFSFDRESSIVKRDHADEPTLKYFWFRDADLQGMPLEIVRAGWSKQGGFKLSLLDRTKGDRLWPLVKVGGQTFDIGAS